MYSIYRPEVKENKEGADTEKAAEQSAESEELVKEKVCWASFLHHLTDVLTLSVSFKVEEKIDENKEKEVAAQ